MTEKLSNSHKCEKPSNNVESLNLAISFCVKLSELDIQQQQNITKTSGL